MYLSKQDIEASSRIKRLNLINSVTGIKPANLIGTKSNTGQSNLAIISSVMHLGSNPALIGFIFRPQHESPRDSYLNIKENGEFTINHVPPTHIENAHYTSAKFPKEVSEFLRCGFTEEYLPNFNAPFVKESLLKIGLKLVDEIPITINQTILMIGEIEHLVFPDYMMDSEGNLDLELTNTVGVGGLNTYYNVKKNSTFPYAHLEDVPEF
jgi:flavin reductase (DIM6/NTAB) family NADH-FMN oxidoreductase RutF